MTQAIMKGMYLGPKATSYLLNTRYRRWKPYRWSDRVRLWLAGKLLGGIRTVIIEDEWIEVTTGDPYWRAQ